MEYLHLLCKQLIIIIYVGIHSPDWSRPGGGAAQWGEGYDSVGTLIRRVRLFVPLLLRRRDILSFEIAEVSTSPKREDDLLHSVKAYL